MSNKEAILEELRRSRLAIARDTAAIAEEFNIFGKLRRSVTSRPFAWLGGAAALGYIFAGPKTKTITKTVPQKGDSSALKKEPATKDRQRWLMTTFNICKLALPFVRPALSAYAARRLGEFSEKIGR
jgi:hypothetical protein